MKASFHFPHWAWAVPGLAVGLGIGMLLGGSSGDAEATGTASADESERPVTRIRPTDGDDDSSASREGVAAGASTAGLDAAAEMMALLESSSSLDRIQRLLPFLDRLSTDEFASVYGELANSRLGEELQSERSLILQAWAERDPFAATAFLQENGAEDWERETTLSTWAAYDPQGAIAWANDAEDAGRVNNWVVGAIRGIASTSPELARDFLMEVDDGRRTQRASLREIQSSILRHGFESAETWIAGLESGTELHERASRYLANDLAEMDPVEAGRWAAGLEDSGTRREVAETVSEHWARQDIETARSWVETLPADTLPEAAEGLIETWADRDPEAAATWLTDLGDNPEFDGARREYVRETWRDNPAAAATMVNSIADNNDRDRYTHRLLNRWSREDEQAAADWAIANQNVISPEVLERVFGE